MKQNKSTDNFRKHTHSNPVQRMLIDRFTTQLIAEMRLLKPKSILDVGCGEGFTLERMRTENVGEKLEGLDFLKTALEIGREIHPRIKFTEGTIYALPYKDNSFDAVICSEVLEHVEFPEKALSELVRVSKKYLLLSVPNEPFFVGANFIRGKNWSRWGNDIEHINHWTSPMFRKFVSRQANIKLVKHPFPWTLIIAEKNV